MLKEYRDRYLGALDNLGLARALYEIMASKPLLAPHGHVDPAMLDENKNFTNPVELLVTPDHYLTRMLASQGISYESLGIPRADGSRNEVDPREVWGILAANWHVFRSTPSRIWMQEIFATLFGVEEILTSQNAASIYEAIDAKLQMPEFKPQALFKRFNIEVLATTDATSDSLSHHQALAKLNLGGLVIPTFRPDDVSDPTRPNWKSDLKILATTSGIEINSFANLLEALRIRRTYFKKHGATATDHGVYSARTLNLAQGEKEVLFNQVLAGTANQSQFDDFHAAMLFEHALMAADDGLVMQIHPGSLRNFDTQIFNKYGADKGFDIPVETKYTTELQPLLNAVGNHPNFRAVLFTLDEAAYSRELAPLAGAYAGLRLGPPWWFLDSLNGLERWRDAVTETAGYYNTVGFIDDTRAFTSIPVRHDVARRFDAGYLAREVARDRITEVEAFELASDLAYNLTKEFFNL